MTELLEAVREYTREYIRLRKETNRLLRQGKIDRQEANHRNGNAKQFLMFARYQLETARKAGDLKKPQALRTSGSESQKTTGFQTSDNSTAPSVLERLRDS